jgi:hypothetical protein
MTRVEALEAVAVAAAVVYVNRDSHEAWSALQAAIVAKNRLDALPAPAPASGETVEVAEPKTVQIAAISPGDGVAPCIFALRDDGTIWGKRVDSDNATWWREDAIPTIRATVATEGGGG